MNPENPEPNAPAPAALLNCKVCGANFDTGTAADRRPRIRCRCHVCHGAMCWNCTFNDDAGRNVCYQCWMVHRIADWHPVATNRALQGGGKP